MATYLYLFKNDAPDRSTAGDMNEWAIFIDGLRESGHFIGGGPLGEGCLRRPESTTDEVSEELGGYMVVTANSLEQAAALLDTCPTTRGGGTVEVRHVPEV